MTTGLSQKDQTFPQTQTHSSVYPDGQETSHIKSSQKVGAGHEDSDCRMPDPNQEWVNEESGEGRNGS